MVETTISFQNLTNTLQITGCTFSVKPPGYDYPKHHHSLFELIHCVAGDIREEIGHEVVVLRPGDWLLIKAGIPHDMHSDAGTSCAFFNVHFDLDSRQLRRSLSTANFVYVPKEAALHTELPSYLKQIDRLLYLELLEDGQDPVQLGLQAYILLMIKEMMAVPAGVQINTFTETTIGENELAHMIEAKLKDNLCGDDTVSSIAEALHVSRSQCTKVFTKIYGLSPRQYMSQLKLNEAKRMLVCTDMSIKAISERLGFHSVYHFSRQFRRWTGKAPTEFRPKAIVSQPKPRGRESLI